MTASWQPFLRAIEAEYDEDLPRLVFADWLEEQGDVERSAFIRLQCRAHQMQAEDGGALTRFQQASEISRAAQELLAQHSDLWCEGLPSWADVRWSFERGFLKIEGTTAQGFLKWAAAIRERAPLAGPLTLSGLKKREKRLFASEHLEMITTLRLAESELTDDGMGYLTRSPHLARVAHLKLTSAIHRPDHLSDEGLAELAGSKNLPALVGLSLCGAYPAITIAGLESLVQSPERAGLRRLDLSLELQKGGVTGARLAELFRSPRCQPQTLTTLNLNDREIGDEGAEILADSASLGRLTDLSLRGAKLTDAGVRMLLESPHLQGLTYLRLSTNLGITDATAKCLLDEGRRWKGLFLNGTSVSAALQENVAEAFTGDGA